MIFLRVVSMTMNCNTASTTPESIPSGTTASNETTAPSTTATTKKEVIAPYQYTLLTNSSPTPEHGDTVGGQGSFFVVKR